MARRSHSPIAIACVLPGALLLIAATLSINCASRVNSKPQRGIQRSMSNEMSRTRDGQGPATSRAATQPEMVRILARHDGDFRREGYPWSLDITANGQATLVIEEAEATRREFSLSAVQWSELRSVLHRVDARSLPAQLGKPVPSGGSRSVEIEFSDGAVVRSTLYNLSHVAPSDRKAARRFIDAWLVIRALFDDPKAVDLREHIEKFEP